MLSLPDISVTVLRNHQKLLLCVGLSLSVQETQQKLDNSQGIATTEETKDLSVQDLRYRGALDMVALGMDRKVRRGLGNAGIESHGMSVPDKFYGEVSSNLVKLFLSLDASNLILYFITPISCSIVDIDYYRWYFSNCLSIRRETEISIY